MHLLFRKGILKKSNKMKKRTIATLVIVLCFSLSFIIAYAYPRFSLFEKRKKVYLTLEKKIARESTKIRGNFSYIIQDLTFPELQIAIGEDELFPAASLIKIPVLAIAGDAIREKRISLNSRFLLRQKDVVGGSGVIKTMKLPTYLTFEQLLELMICQSDNTATNKVISLLGASYINKKFRKLGLHKTTLRRKMMDFRKRKKGIENYTTASEITLLLENIYHKKFIGKEFSELALGYLKKQKINDRIPRYLPDTVTVAHKTGLERATVHDAGIVFSAKGDYIICILTKGIKDYKTAKHFIAYVSLLTYRMYE